MDVEMKTGVPGAPATADMRLGEGGSASRLPIDPDEAVQTLESLDEPSARAFVDRLVEGRDGVLLSRIASRLTRKAHQKAVKRGMHKLKSLGVTVPDPERPAVARPSVLDPIEEENLNGAFLGMPSPLGDRMLHVFWREPTGDYLFLLAVLNDEKGLIALGPQETRRRHARRFRQALILDTDSPTARVSAGDGARAILEAAGISDALSIPPPPELALVRSHLEEMRASAEAVSSPPAEAPPPPAALSQARERASRSGELHKLPALRTWLCDDETLQHCRMKLDEVLTSDLLLDENQREDQIQVAFEREARGFVEKVGPGRLASRLRQVAEILRSRGETEAADLAFATSTEIESGEIPPFVLDMVRKAFRITKPEAGEAGASGTKASRLVLLPWEAMQGRSDPGAPVGGRR